MVIAFRVDQSPTIGSGHFNRCLNLAKILKKKKVKIKFICRNNFLSKKIKKKLKNYKIQINFLKGKNTSNFFFKEDAIQTIKILKKNKIDWLVVDHYELDYKWESLVKRYAKKILVIDDLANRKHKCDLLLDQNYVHNYTNRYNNILKKDCVKLLGPRYSLLDSSFLEKNRKVKKNRNVKNIFVFFSGSYLEKIENIFLNILNSKEFRKFKIDFVVANKNRIKNTFIKSKINKNLKIYQPFISMANLMKKADLAIGGGGTNTWERMFLGIPSLVLCLASNQKKVCDYLSEKKIIIYLGNTYSINKKKIKLAIIKAIKNIQLLRNKSLKWRYIIDGMGAYRVSEVISPSDKKDLILRTANKNDCITYFSWVNDPSVITNSFHNRRTNINEHSIWFKKQCKNPNSYLFIAEAKGLPVGQIRFNCLKDQATIDYSLDKIVRNRGWSEKLVRLGVKKLHSKRPSTLKAEVKHFNKKSIAVFKNLGFKEQIINKNRHLFKLSSNQLIH